MLIDNQTTHQSILTICVLYHFDQCFITSSILLFSLFPSKGRIHCLFSELFLLQVTIWHWIWILTESLYLWQEKDIKTSHTRSLINKFMGQYIWLMTKYLTNATDKIWHILWPYVYCLIALFFHNCSPPFYLLLCIWIPLIKSYRNCITFKSWIFFTFYFTYFAEGEKKNVR